MQEIELKFLVPESRLKSLMRQTHVKSSQVTQLAAHYYDTPDQQLAQAGIGLRIRKEAIHGSKPLKLVVMVSRHAWSTMPYSIMSKYKRCSIIMS